MKVQRDGLGVRNHGEPHPLGRNQFSPLSPQMTVWSHSTASVDPISPSSPTPPVGRPKPPPCALPVRPPLPHPDPDPTRLHSQKSPLSLSLLPASSCGRIYNLQLCVFQEGGKIF